VPVRTKQLDAGLGVIIMAEGLVTSQEYDETLTKHLSQPDEVIKKYIYTIVDSTNTTKFSVELKYLKKNAQHCMAVAKINPHVIISMVTESAVLFSVARVWTLLAHATGWNIEVFRTRKDADKWLLQKLHDMHAIDTLKLDHEEGTVNV